MLFGVHCLGLQTDTPTTLVIAVVQNMLHLRDRYIYKCIYANTHLVLNLIHKLIVTCPP